MNDNQCERLLIAASIMITLVAGVWLLMVVVIKLID